MNRNARDCITALLTPEAVRQRCHELYRIAKADDLEHFRLFPDRLEAVIELVLEENATNYPNGEVPFHSRWRHFEFGSRNLWAELAAVSPEVSTAENARRRVDLAVVSVLLDAGAGAAWKYADAATGLILGRSEGLALASIRLLESGRLSRYGREDPIRADASVLESVTPERLAKMLQVGAGNPLVGMRQRSKLLNRLGSVARQSPEMFGRDGDFRPGHLYDYLTTLAKENCLPAREILIALLRGLGPIWPEGETIEDISVGDVGRHARITRPDITNGILPFHKLSQWMAYSLIEPLEEAGIRITDMDALTGLAEYRNGGLFIDTGVLALREEAAISVMHHHKSPLVVEWRGLTVALLDEVVSAIRQRTGDDTESLPLACVLQGGTWSAGRRIARQRRPDGRPPLVLESDGTIF